MKKLFILIGILSMLVAKGQSFRFSSDGVKRQSAGIYDENNTLIRTLFSGKIYPANTYTYDWDGRDDEGRVAPKGKYSVKILSNNVKYEWDGIMANTSDSMTGTSKWRGYGFANGLATAGPYVYVAQGFAEFRNSIFRFHTSDPQKRLYVKPFERTFQEALAVCTDSEFVYWAEWGKSASNKEKSAWIIYATRSSDNSEVTFSNGQKYTLIHGVQHSVIGLQDEAISPQTAKGPTAMAVQRKGSFLFVSRKSGNRVDVYHKKTGAFVRSLTYSKPTGLSIDKEDMLWMITGDNTVSKYKVQTDGRLSESILTLKGLSEPQNVCVSHDGSFVLVADCGDSQQLKAFTTTTGAALWTLGTKGGYANSSIVTDTRFMFSDINGVNFEKFRIPAITFQADGSFWFSDNGNQRMLHFDANRKYVNKIMFLNRPYFTTIVEGDPAKLVYNNLEFTIDYTKPLKTAWKLVRNYGYKVDAAHYEHHHRGIAYAAKLSNGRIYGLYRRAGFGPISNKWEVVELTEEGLRMTGVLISDLGQTSMDKDGSIIYQGGRKVGEPVLIKRKVITGFDRHGNPTYSEYELYLQTPPFTAASPVHWKQKIPAVTKNGYYWFFDGNPKLEAGDYHLGAIPVGGKDWKVLTSKGTGRTYRDDFPSDGRFDDGNGVNSYAGSQVVASGQHVIWGYHGEFWRNGQVNKYNHYWENGLFLGQFGVTFQEAGIAMHLGSNAPAQMAGNALSPVLIDPADGNLYLYHGDEAHHGGIHRWKITGVETITEEVIPLNEEKTMNFNAGFSADKKSGCLPLEVKFYDESDVTAGTITKWFWDFGDGNTSTESNPRHVYTKPGSYQVTLVATNESGCTKSFRRTSYIEVFDKPTIAIVNDTISCTNADISFKSDFESSDAFRFDWKWDFGNGQTDTLQSPEPQTYRSAGTYNVSLTLTDGYGCSAQAFSKVTVHPSPVVDAGPDAEICLGSTQQLKASGAEKYIWENANGLSCTDCESPVANPSDWTQYKVTGTNAYGCNSSDWVTVSVRQPFQLEIDGKKDICIGEIAELTASGADQYTWLTPAGETNPVINVSPQLSTLYRVTAKDDASCFTDTASVYVNVHQLPVIHAGTDVEICRGSAQQLKVSGAAQYNWNATSALSCTDCPSPLAAPNVTTQFVVTGYDNYGCSSTDSVLVTVHQPFNVTIDPVADICIGRTATLTARGADQYSWSPSIGISNPASATATVMPQSNTQYTVVAKDDAGCFTDTASVQVTVWSYPTVEAGEVQTLSVGNTLKLSPVYSTDVNSYRWSHPQTLSCSNCAFPEAKPKSETTYRIEVANNGGCRASDEVTVRVICNNGNLFIPNTFSPNQDGRNDRFFPRGSGIDRVKSFKVFNRWGELVFSNENFPANSPDKGWDGRYKGQILPSDVFVYSCEVVCTNNELLTFKGDVTLLR